MSIEHWIYTVPLRLRSLFRRKRAEQELDEELHYHLQNRIEAEMARGATAEEARYTALRAMEGMTQQKEACRDRRGANWIDSLIGDLRYAARMLRKSPVFTSVAILSLALGIGANTAVFSMIDALLLRPLPVPHVEQLVNVAARGGSPLPRYYLTYPMFEEIARQNRIFSGIFTWSGHQFQMRSGADMVHVDGMVASGQYFSTLGVGAELGRTFTKADDKPDGGKDGPVAVISDAFWSREFHRKASAVGSGITLDGVRFSVIGVMPPNFFGAEAGTRPDIWVPLWMTTRIGDSVCITGRDCWWLVVMGRLKPGVSEERAQADLKAITPNILRNTTPLAWTTASQKKYLHWQFYTVPAANGWTFLRIRFSNPLTILMTLVGIVLLIACGNMANLLLARASSRHREIAVRLAMGAGRARIVRQLMTESLVLSLAGGLAGLLLAQWSTRLLVRFLSGTRQDTAFDLHPDWRIVLFTLLAAVASGLLFGLAPALRATRIGISASLKERVHNLRRDEGRIGIGKLLLGLQAALSILLVAGAGLFAGSLIHLLTLNPGFDPHDVLLMGVDTDRRTDRALLPLYGRLLGRVSATPGVKAASLIWFTPLSESGWDNSLSIPGRTDLSEQQRDTFINLVGPRFFEVMGIPLFAGREFQPSDTATSEKVGIINELAARRFFRKSNPIGMYVLQDKTVVRIVGIAQNTKYLNLRDAEPLELYIPYTQKTQDIPSLSFVMKTSAPLLTMQGELRKAVHEIAPDIPISLLKTMQQQVDDSLGRERLMASLSVFFGVLALLLTSIGLYGILGYMVTRRTGEIGVRMALGAPRHNVIWLILRDALTHMIIGIAAGAVAVLAMSRFVASMLYGMQPNNPGNLVMAVFILATVAGVAAYLPAYRASRVDPMQALRAE